ncbi:MAG: GDP-mannose 4,6-dehydratase [Planctomycetes bacterium]|nr:GDP-mannose 4,6-dehydratase [Planctomycetota bacterium]
MTERGAVLVTGAAGFIGSHVVEALLAQGRPVIGVDNFDPFYSRQIKEQNAAHCRAAGCKFVEGDLCDAGFTASLFERTKPTGVIHLAARAGVRPSIADPIGYVRANVLATMVVLEAARGAGCERVVLASSSSVYGNNTKVPFSEDDPVENPISPYAASKRSCELIAHAHQHLTGMPTACLRFFTVIGPRQRPDLAVSLFLSRVSRGEPIRMFGDGSTSRDYTYIEDIVGGVLASYERIDVHGYRVWNLGGSDPVSLAEMIRTVGEVVGKEPIVTREPMQPGDVVRTYADLSRARSELDYEPATPFREGVAQQWAWMRETRQ